MGLSLHQELLAVLELPDHPIRFNQLLVVLHRILHFLLALLSQTSLLLFFITTSNSCPFLSTSAAAFSTSFKLQLSKISSPFLLLFFTLTCTPFSWASTLFFSASTALRQSYPSLPPSSAPWPRASI